MPVAINFVHSHSNSVKTLWVAFTIRANHVIASCLGGRGGGGGIVAVCPFHWHCRLSRKLDQLQNLRDYFAK